MNFINGGDLKNFNERQKFCRNREFVCSCELCQEEEIDNNDETYKKLQNLKEEVEKIKSHLNPFEIEKVIACRKQMYSLAENKKAPMMYILNILDEALNDGYVGKKKDPIT